MVCERSRATPQQEPIGGKSIVTPVMQCSTVTTRA